MFSHIFEPDLAPEVLQIYKKELIKFLFDKISLYLSPIRHRHDVNRLG